MNFLYQKYIWVLIFFTGIVMSQEFSFFNQIFPFTSFKAVVDTCVRSYSDVLLLHDHIANHERQEQIDESLDLLMGRLIRLQSYIEQVIYAYKFEATVSLDDLEYLIHMFEYLELTIAQNNYDEMAKGLNGIINKLKHDLQQALNLRTIAFYNTSSTLFLINFKNICFA